MPRAFKRRIVSMSSRLRGAGVLELKQGKAAYAIRAIRNQLAADERLLADAMKDNVIPEIDDSV